MATEGRGTSGITRRSRAPAVFPIKSRLQRGRRAGAARSRRAHERQDGARARARRTFINIYMLMEISNLSAAADGEELRYQTNERAYVSTNECTAPRRAALRALDPARSTIAIQRLSRARPLPRSRDKTGSGARD